MYDGDVTGFSSPGRHARFPTKDIVTPIVLLYVDRDSLVDIQKMLKELPDHMTVKRLAFSMYID